MKDWDQILADARDAASKHSDEYSIRLEREFKEVTKQGMEDYWIDLVNSGEKFEENKNGLVLPFLLGITSIDPIDQNIDKIMVRHPDFPDIDIDFLPESRDNIKQYIIDQYGEDHVCSVGNWVTYKPKSALQDVARAYGNDFREVIIMSKNLPDDFDGMTIEELEKIRMKESDNPDLDVEKEYEKYKTFFEYWENNPKIVEMAFKVNGHIKTDSTHAGGVIISSECIHDIVPLKRKKATDPFASQWTEGKSTQMSKFGLIKFDILGLKTIYFIWKACEFIKENRGITFDWSDMDPDDRRLGWQFNPDGSKIKIAMDDPETMQMLNNLDTDSIFQHETPIQKSIIEDGGIKDFWDMVAYTSLGRPGPMDMIPTYIENRDDESKSWADSETDVVKDILNDTHGVITFQEQLTDIWMRLGKFSLVQAEESRKIISKKWLDKLPRVKERWIKGATERLGENLAIEWWEKMQDFGRYAFNKSHAVAYSIISFRCSYLKAHFGPEWWASVLSECHQDKRPKYMGIARGEGVGFATMKAGTLQKNYSVDDSEITLGLTSIKGIGDNAAEMFCKDVEFKTITEFIEKTGKHKTVMERLIKLGAFDHVNENRRGVWSWYLYKYGPPANQEVKDLRKLITDRFMPDDVDINVERARQKDEYKKMYPKRNKIPKKIENWTPKIGHRFDTPSFTNIIDSFENYSLNEILVMEKEFLGFYWSNPMDIYHNFGHTINDSKESGVLEAVIEQTELRRTHKGSEYMTLHITDGVEKAKMNIWSNVIASLDDSILNEGVGIRCHVEYKEKYNSFTLKGGSIIPLDKK